MTARQHPSAPDLPHFPWAGLLQNPSGWSFLRQSATAAEPVMRSAARAQLEVSSFVGTRIKAWTGVPETLARCRTPVDLAQAQMAFWQTAMQDYATASRQLMVAMASAVPGPLGGMDGEQPADRDFITFPDSADESEERRRPGASRRAA